VDSSPLANRRRLPRGVSLRNRLSRVVDDAARLDELPDCSRDFRTGGQHRPGLGRVEVDLHSSTQAAAPQFPSTSSAAS